jgi:hypothetical protein
MIVLLALLYLLAWTSAAHAVTAIAAILSAAGITGTAFTIGSGATAVAVSYATIAATVIVTAASLGLSLLLAPKPAGGTSQITIKQARPPRRRLVGRDKLAGAFAWLVADRNQQHRVLVFCEGPVHEIEEVWFNDVRVELLLRSGDVYENQTSPWHYIVFVEKKTGTATQAASAILRGDFDASTDYSTIWSEDHRLKGLCYLVVRAWAPSKPNQFSWRYPNGFPDIRIVASMAVYDPRDESTGASDNPALWIMDYLTNERGYNISSARIDTESFIAFADMCEDPVPVKAGGSEPRYRCGGSYDLTEEPRAVLRRLLETCDAEIYTTAEGKVAIRGGVWEEPTVTIDQDAGHIIAYTYEQGNDRLAAFNRLVLSYKSPDHDYQITETEAWEDEESQALLGEVKSQDLTLSMVPSHGQARRLAKIVMADGNPRHKLTLQTNMFGLNVIGQRFIRVKIAEINLDDTFKVKRHEINGDLLTCAMELVSVSADAYSWDPETEEGDPPPVPQGLDDPRSFVPTPTPTGLALTVIRTSFSDDGAFVTVRAEVDEPFGGWSTRFEYRIDGSSDEWLVMTIGDTPYQAETNILSDGETYEVRAAHLGQGGIPGTYTTPETIVVIYDTIAPGAAIDLAVTAGAGTADVEWVNPNSANYYATRIYRGATNVFDDASLITTRYGAANVADIYTDTLTAGTYYWWAVAINRSGPAASPAGPVTGTVT